MSIKAFYEKMAELYENYIPFRRLIDKWKKSNKVGIIVIFCGLRTNFLDILDVESNTNIKKPVTVIEMKWAYMDIDRQLCKQRETPVIIDDKQIDNCIIDFINKFTTIKRAIFVIDKKTNQTIIIDREEVFQR